MVFYNAFHWFLSWKRISAHNSVSQPLSANLKSLAKSTICRTWCQCIVCGERCYCWRHQSQWRSVTVFCRLKRSVLQRNYGRDLVVTPAVQIFWHLEIRTSSLPWSQCRRSSGCIRWIDAYWVVRMEHPSYTLEQSRLLPLPAPVQRKTTSGKTAQASEAHVADDCFFTDEERYSAAVKTFSLNSYTEQEIFFFLGQLGVA